MVRVSISLLFFFLLKLDTVSVFYFIFSRRGPRCWPCVFPRNRKSIRFENNKQTTKKIVSFRWWWYVIDTGSPAEGRKVHWRHCPARHTDNSFFSYRKEDSRRRTLTLQGQRSRQQEPARRRFETDDYMKGHTRESSADERYDLLRCHFIPSRRIPGRDFHLLKKIPGKIDAAAAAVWFTPWNYYVDFQTHAKTFHH